jgi:beta-lactamase class A
MFLVKKLLRNKITYFSLGFLVLGILVGLLAVNIIKPQSLVNNSNPAGSESSGSLEFHSGGYKFINPLYECNTGENYGTEKLTDLESIISSYINSVVANNSTTRTSVYFRDLNNGPWFGINEHDDFNPSSLLKVPIMMAYFKLAEVNPSILTKKIKYTQDPAGLITQNFPPKEHLVKGNSYTVEDLIERMIAASDNVSLGLLLQNIDPAQIDKVTLDLGITTATDSTPDNFMDVAEYSTLFRVLYYSTYLDKDYSEKALEILSKSEFTNGIVASVPSGVAVAHKFGERQLPDGTNQLHDCGIVYAKRPYLICIMTKGPNFNDLETTIQQISGKVYAEFTKNYN